MPLAKLPFAPGVNKEGTQYSAQLGWYDSDKIRFRKGRVEKIGGWEKYSQNAVNGVPRALQDWGTSQATAYLAVGTNLKYYVESGGAFQDVTPIRATTAAGDVTFSATNGSSTITVSDTAHGAVASDFVTFSGAVTLGGNITASVLNQEYQIATVVDVDSYTITAKDTSGVEVTANASDTGNGGASVVGAYQINTGLNIYVQTANGWGSGNWGESPWGEGTGLSVANQLRLYSQDIFGDDLIFNPRLGGVYYWDESAGGRAFDIGQLPSPASTPTAALQVMVSDVDRHVICFGANPIGSSSIDPLLVRWSDQENAADWQPTATNTAGGQVLSTGTSIIGAVKTRQEILIFTDEGIQSMRFIGAPFVFSFSLVSQNMSIVSPRAAASIGDAVYFMDLDGFYIYQGSIQRVPCSVHSYVFDNLNRDQAFKSFSYNNPDFSEITWFYPVGTGNTEATSYVTYNYSENVWAVGTMDRSAFISAQTKEYPVGAGVDVSDLSANYVYSHELGNDADGAELVAYVESGGFDLTDGNSFSFGKRFIPDFRFSGNPNAVDISIVVKGRDFPLDDFTDLATSSITASSTQAHIRTRSREVAVKITSSGTGYGWTLGDMRFDFRTDGRR